MRFAMMGLVVLGMAISGCGGGEEEAAVKPYPLNTCMVSDEKLGSMGEPTSLIHEGQEIKFCCKGCEDDFKKDPKKYLAKIKAAGEKHDHDDHDGHDH